MFKSWHFRARKKHLVNGRKSTSLQPREERLGSVTRWGVAGPVDSWPRAPAPEALDWPLCVVLGSIGTEVCHQRG